MPRRPCLGCQRLISSGSRCPACDTHALDYGAAYQRERNAVVAVATVCGRCHEPFTPDNPATGQHSTALRHGGRGSPIVAWCARCNYSHRNDPTPA